jgi:hypothetical protein
MLTRFWFKFRRTSPPDLLSMGVGITAYDLADARRMLREQVFPLYGEEPVDEAEVIENIDVRTLEEKHVRPNMGNPAARGVWFPML